MAKGRGSGWGLKLTAFQVAEIHKFLKYGIRSSEIASYLGLTYGIVYKAEKEKYTGKKSRTSRLLRCSVVDGKPLQSCLQGAVTKVNYKFGSRYFCSRHGLPAILDKNTEVISVEAVK